MRTLLRGGQVVTATEEFRADLLLADGVIRAVQPDLEADAEEVVDVSGCKLLPGLVDSHTHLDMPTMGTVTADDFASGTAAAAAGGTTTIVDFAMQTDGSLVEGMRTWQAKAAGRAHIDYGFHMCITDADDRAIAEMKDLVEAGITSFKVFMAFKGAFMVDDEHLYRVLRRTAEVGGLVQVHAENGDVIAANIADALARGETGPHAFPGCRPATTEQEATSRAIHVAQWAKRPIFVVHVSAALAAQEIQQARARGVPVYGETCGHYLTLTVDEIFRPGFEGAKYVCSPPLRTEADQDALWSALRGGSLLAVTTDHCPFNFAGQKELGVGDFSKIPNGMPTIEHRLVLLHEHGVRQGRLSFPQLVALTSTNNARLFGLDAKGALAPGFDADVVVFDPQAHVTISAEHQQMAVDYTPYEGWTCTGAPVMVLSRGEVVVRDGQVASSPGRGRYVPRSLGAFGPGEITRL